MVETDRRVIGGVGNQRQARFVALPPLLYGLAIAAIALVLLAIGGPSGIVDVWGPSAPHTIGLVVGLVMLIALVIAGVLSALNRLPVWVYTWVGADLAGLLLVLNLVAEDRAYVVSTIGDIVVLALFFLGGLATAGSAALKGWRPAGLLGIGLSATVGLSLCFWVVAGPFHLGLGLLAAPLGLAMAVLAYVYFCGPDVSRMAALLGTGLLSAAVAWGVDRVFQSWDLFQGQPSQFWFLLAVSGGPLVLAPLGGLLGELLRRALVGRRP